MVQRLIPGGPYLNETGTAQRLIPGGPFVNEKAAGGFRGAWVRCSGNGLLGQGASMYPRNAASPPRIAIGPVVQISDGAVQTSGCTVRVLEQGGTEGDGGGTTAYSTDGVVLYTPTQAETDQSQFILIAKKTGCIPASITVPTSASAVAGYAGLDWATINAPTTTQNLSGTSTKAVEPTVAGRTLDISAGGEAGVDWANVGTPGSTVSLSATTVATVTTTTTATTATNLTNLPSIPANWLTAAGIAAGALDGKGNWNIGKTGYALTATTGLGNQTANITGNVSGSVGSVTAVSTGAITTASFAAGAIDAAAIATDAIGSAEISAAAVTKIQTGLATPTNITAGTITTVSGNVAGSVGSVTTVSTGAISSVSFEAGAITGTAIGGGAITAAKIQSDAIGASEIAADAVTKIAQGIRTELATELARLDAATSTRATPADVPSAGSIAEAVWDEAISGHLTAGSTGNALNAAGSGGDPWSTTLPGAYGSGTAGKIIGDNINATIGSRSTQASVDDLPTNAELTSALGTADDAVLAVLGTPAGASLAADVAAVKGQTAAIETDTQDVQARLPAALVSGRMDASVGAMAANVMTASAAADDLTTELQAGLATASALSTVAGYIDTEVAAILAAVDTEVAAIKAKTDNLPASPAATGDIPSAGAIADAVLDEAVEGAVTLRESVRLANAALGGKASGLDTNNPKFRDLADTKDRIDATVDNSGNRSAVTRDLT